MKSYDDIESEFINLVKELDKYDRVSNLLYDDSFEPKKTKILGKKIHNLATKLMEYDLEKFIQLLDYNDLSVREMCAEYVYPLFPKKSLLIMIQYMNSFDNEIDKIKIKSKIEGLKRKDDFFIILYKKLYKTDDLNSLCRE